MYNKEGSGQEMIMIKCNIPLMPAVVQNMSVYRALGCRDHSRPSLGYMQRWKRSLQSLNLPGPIPFDIEVPFFACK